MLKDSNWYQCKTTNLVTHPAVNVYTPCQNAQKTPRQKSGEISFESEPYFALKFRTKCENVFKCVYFSNELGISQLRYRHPDRIPKLVFALLPARGAGTTKDDLHPKPYWDHGPKRAVSMNGKVFLYIQEGVITLLGVSLMSTSS